MFKDAMFGVEGFRNVFKLCTEIAGQWAAIRRRSSAISTPRNTTRRLRSVTQDRTTRPSGLPSIADIVLHRREPPLRATTSRVDQSE
jgi:hypothetical protein